jgi:hypothetical protein
MASIGKLDVITPQIEKFASNVAHGMTYSNALRDAYPDTSSTWSPSYTWSKASELRSHPKVRARIDELKAQVEKLGLWSREQSARALIDVIETADKKSDVVSAIKALNEMSGYNAPAKIEHTGLLNNITVHLVESPNAGS